MMNDSEVIAGKREKEKVGGRCWWLWSGKGDWSESNQ